MVIDNLGRLKDLPMQAERQTERRPAIEVQVLGTRLYIEPNIKPISPHVAVFTLESLIYSDRGLSRPRSIRDWVWYSPETPKFLNRITYGDRLEDRDEVESDAVERSSWNTAQRPDAVRAWTVVILGHQVNAQDQSYLETEDLMERLRIMLISTQWYNPYHFDTSRPYVLVETAASDAVRARNGDQPNYQDLWKLWLRLSGIQPQADSFIVSLEPTNLNLIQYRPEEVLPSVYPYPSVEAPDAVELVIVVKAPNIEIGPWLEQVMAQDGRYTVIEGPTVDPDNTTAIDRVGREIETRLESGQSVIVVGSGLGFPRYFDRSTYTSIGRALGYPVRIVWFPLPLNGLSSLPESSPEVLAYAKLFQQPNLAFDGIPVFRAT